tara:strand:+ start:2260 stop:2526 length:267 start_codon:yes stop_codon:yes gene_type:complete
MSRIEEHYLNPRTFEELQVTLRKFAERDESMSDSVAVMREIIVGGGSSGSPDLIKEPPHHPIGRGRIVRPVVPDRPERPRPRPRREEG